MSPCRADHIRSLLQDIRALCRVPEGALPLHAPVFHGRERDYVLNAIDSTFVSSVGAYVTRFENMLQEITGTRHVVACVNGTAALQVALHLAGVRTGELVITQALSFVATANAIVHSGAEPVFLDVDTHTPGLSPDAVEEFLRSQCERASHGCRHKATGKRIAACVPMHTFGLPCHMERLTALCADWNIPVVEDAAEALGSLQHGRHCGTFGLLGTLSFNGNKIVTTGGGGAILTNDDALGALAKHLTTTAKLPHAWEFRHDQVAWNYRMPNLNAALGCAQLERLDAFVEEKRQRAQAYAALFADSAWQFVSEPEGSRSNYWLCAVRAPQHTDRDYFLNAANAEGIMCRPAWVPLHTLPMYAHCIQDTLMATNDAASRLVNLPSGVLD